MDKIQLRQFRWMGPLAVMVLLIVLSMLVGCGNATQPSAVSRAKATSTVTENYPPSTSAPSETATLPPISASPTLTSKEQYAVMIWATRAAVRTEVALSGLPTGTPGMPPPYTGPSPTPHLGLDPCANVTSPNPYLLSCWRGYYNGSLFNVSSGREGRLGDMTQGLVWVYNANPYESTFYPTPDKVGIVRIVSVDGTLFTLEAGDHQPVIIYTFDLATRQWGSP